MRRIDLVIAAVLVAAVVFSFIGVATYERAPGATEYDVTWNSLETTLASKQANRNGNGDVSIDYPIALDNLTEVTLTVRVQGNGPRPSAVTASVKVTPVNASEQSKQIQLPANPQGGGGEASIVVPLREPPNATTTRGASENETLAELNQTHRSQVGKGTWRITVTISGGTGVPVVGSEPYQITVTGAAMTYAAAVQPRTPDINR